MNIDYDSRSLETKSEKFYLKQQVTAFQSHWLTHTVTITQTELHRYTIYIHTYMIYAKFLFEYVNYISRDELAFISIKAAK